MSRGSGKVERRIGELFAAIKDRALSITEIAAHAYELPAGTVPDRKQRQSATRAAHRLLKRAADAITVAETAFDQVVSETTAALGREPNNRRRTDRHLWFFIGSRARVIDPAFRVGGGENPRINGDVAE